MGVGNIRKGLKGKPRKIRRYKTHRNRQSTLTAEEYRTKFLLGGNQWHSRWLRYCRMMKRETQ